MAPESNVPTAQAHLGRQCSSIPDGIRARIGSDAAAAMINRGRSMALLGSELNNGDRISGPLATGIRAYRLRRQAHPRALDHHCMRSQPRADLNG